MISQELQDKVNDLSRAVGDHIDRGIQKMFEPGVPIKPTFRRWLMSATKRFRWWIADFVAPDIHEYCD